MEIENKQDKENDYEENFYKVAESMECSKETNEGEMQMEMEDKDHQEIENYDQEQEKDNVEIVNERSNNREQGASECGIEEEKKIDLRNKTTT